MKTVQEPVAPDVGAGRGAEPAPDRKAFLLALAKPLGILAVIVAYCVLAHEVGVLIVVLALVAMVMLHELGHFATAKWTGMKVTEYYFGFGPKLWSVSRGETTYGVKALPAGGYVKITGMTMLEEVHPDDEPRSYRQATFPRRILVATAGSITHFLLAFVLLWSMLLIDGNVVDKPVAPTVAGLLTFSPGPTPAAVAGLKNGDVFVSIDGHPTADFASLAKLIGDNPGKPLQVVVRRDGRLVPLVVTPVARSVCVGNASHPVEQGQIGVLLNTNDVTSHVVGPLAAVGQSFSYLGTLFGDTLSGLGAVFSPHGLSAFAHDVKTAGTRTTCVPGPGIKSSAPSSTSQSGSNGELLSFLGLIQLGSQALKEGGVATLLYLLALANIAIGLINLFPMLPLDGGHVAIAVYERIRSRKGERYHADVMKLLPVAYAFLAFIVLIGLAAFYVNLVQPAHLPGG